MTPTPQAPWWALYALAGVLLVIFGAGLAASFAWGNETQRTTMLTATVTLSGMAIGYFFGSSTGSAKKDDALMGQQGERPPPLTPPLR